MQTLTNPASLRDRIREERAKEIPHRQELASIAIKTLFPSLPSSQNLAESVKKNQKEGNG